MPANYDEEEDFGIGDRKYSEISGFQPEDLPKNAEESSLKSKIIGEQREEEDEKRQKSVQESFEQPSLVLAIFAYLGYAVPVLFGYVREFMRALGFEKVVGTKEYHKHKVR